MEFSKEKMDWLEFDIFSQYSHLFQGVFSRHGGTSQKEFASLNVSFDVGDHPDCVKKNRQLLQDAIEAKHLVSAKQVHGKKVILIKDPLAKLPAADGLITKEKEIALMISHADCQAAIFYDPLQNIIGAAHAGWKGLILNIYKEMVDAFVQLGSKTKDLLVGISPSLGPDHSEFINYKKEFPKTLWRYLLKDNFLDLWQLAKDQLLQEGILEQNIENMELCTYCEKERFFSFRRDKKTGRNATVISMR